MFGHDQDKKPLTAGAPRADISSGGKNQGEHNRLWQSVATGSNAIQPKLAVSQHDDPHEREADRAAEAVMRTAEPSQSDNPLSIGDGPQKLQRMCDDCEEEEQGLMRKTRTTNADAAGTAPPIVREVLSSAGQPLDRPTRSFMEPRFGTDLGHVRVHADEWAANSASAVEARAYTVNRDIVFASGEYAPDTPRGRQLLSHELAHVMQQGSGTPVRVQRQTDFGEMYRGRDGKVRSHLDIEYDDYKAGLGKTEFSSKTGGHRFPMAYPITREELLKVFRGVAKDLKNAPDPVALGATVDFYVNKLNQAFRLFKIDTVEAQASYIANAWNEADQFRYMTETQKSVSSNKPYESDPKNVNLNRSWLKQAETGKVVNKDKSVTDVVNYEPGGSINPKSDWDKSFIGRGPVQVTHRHNYVQVLAVMEKRADELKQIAEDWAKKRKEEGSTNPQETTPRQSQDEQDLREAIDKIKADPREAANPKYAFMFSAGFMKMPDDTGVRGDVKATQGQVTSWMGKQPADAKQKKELAYWSAYSVLMKKWKADTKEDASMFQ